MLAAGNKKTTSAVLIPPREATRYQVAGYGKSSLGIRAYFDGLEPYSCLNDQLLNFLSKYEETIRVYKSKFIIIQKSNINGKNAKVK